MRPAGRIGGGVVVLAAVVAGCAAPRPDLKPTTSAVSDPSRAQSQTRDADAVRAAVDTYVRARNGADVAAFRATICASVIASNTAGSRPSPIHVAVDHVNSVRIDGDKATASVDLRYLIGEGGSTQTIGPFPGIEWTFVREQGSWKQCSPPAFSSAGSGRPAG